MAIDSPEGVYRPRCKFGFVKVNVVDLDQASTFYEVVLGLQLAQTVELPGLIEKVYFSPGMATGPFVVLYHGMEMNQLAVGNGWGPLGFFVDDVDATYAFALANGGKPCRAPYDSSGIRIAFFLDPEDHEIEVASTVIAMDGYK